LLVKRALVSALAITISLIAASGACAQSGPSPGSVPIPVQEKPAPPKAPPAAPPMQIAPVANAPSDAPPLPSTEQLVSLVRNVLLAVNDANLTWNYTVLRDLSAPDSQALNTPERLEESFRPIRQQGTDFSIVAVATPRRLERSRQQRLLRNRLGSFAGIDARRAEEQQFCDAGAVCCMDDVRFDEQVVVKKIGREGVIGVQPPTRPAVRKMICGRCDAIQSSTSDWRRKSTPARPGSRSRVQDSR